MSEPTPDAPSPRPHRWWQAWVSDAEGRPERVLLVASDRHADGTRVDLTLDEVEELDDLVVAEAVLRNGVVVALHVSAAFAPRAPVVWFVELPADASDASDASGAASDLSDLLAFGGPERAPGELVGGAAAASLTVASSDQLGAIRWRPATGEVDQVYVQPDRRRQHLGSVLVAAVACLNVARGLPRLWGDGERTALGETFRNARSWRDRTADLEHLAPPMTPGDAPAP